MPHRFRASQMGYYKQCPGRWIASDGLQETESPDAARGTRIHKALEQYYTKGAEPHLSADVMPLFDACCQEHNKLTKEATSVKYEQELSLTFDVGGTVDVLVEFDNHDVEVIDWKTGWLPLPEDAIQFQLSIYLAAAMQATPNCQFGEAVAFQPLTGKSTVISMGPDDVDEVVEACTEVVCQSEREDKIVLQPDREACKWCTAKLTCPGARRVSAELVDNAETAFKLLAPQQMSTLLDKAKMVEPMVAETIKQARDFMKKGGVIDGWRLQERKTYALVRDEKKE